MAITLDGTNGITASGDLSLNNGAADGAQVKLLSSGYSDWNLDNYSGSLRAYYNSTEYLKVTSAGLMQFNSGYGSVATAYGCRAWVNFNGTGTVAIRASGNVSSITDNGEGDYTLNFTTAMPDANYSPVFAASDNNDASRGDSGGIFNSTVAPTSSALRFLNRLGANAASNGQNYDSTYISVAIFR